MLQFQNVSKITVNGPYNQAVDSFSTFCHFERLKKYNFLVIKIIQLAVCEEDYLFVIYLNIFHIYMNNFHVQSLYFQKYQWA